MRQRPSGIHTQASLAWLLDPLPVDTFLDEIWGRSHYHVSRDSPNYFTGLLEGADSVDALLAVFRPHLSLVSLVRGAERKEQYVYRRADGAFDVAAIGQDFADGYTIVLESVQRYVRPIARLAHAIDVELDFATQVNAYFTPPQSRGFVAHCDDHDALVVQIQGSKIWHLYEGIDVAPHRISSQGPVAPGELPAPTDVCLKTGDVLYVPRGRVHAAESTSELSAHLTVGLHAPSLLLLATRMLNALNNTDDRIHAQLPPRFLSDPEVRTHLDAFAQHIAERFSDPETLAGALDSLQADLVKRGQCQPLGAGIADAVDVDDRTEVLKCQPLYCRVTDNASGVALHFAQSVVNAGPDYREALQFLAESTEPLRVSGVPGLGEAERIELVRTLILQGFLIRLTSE
ncbi:cupin domain-containing protein [Mycobacterium paraterrae]|uniref:Cupin domain-containing protein n=1 Tax=Mycobacterium paraterrae TaxID=577492 RepID=A0ABY3VHG9_9MYCO|nr:cupin domain-containing protein [Mycobacterium paraterrae]UMB67609.1 cupin domain-containing protein [Mycobacterium paraterrae]